MPEKLLDEFCISEKDFVPLDILQKVIAQIRIKAEK